MGGNPVPLHRQDVGGRKSFSAIPRRSANSENEMLLRAAAEVDDDEPCDTGGKNCDAVGDDCEDQSAKAGRSVVNPSAEDIGKEEHVASEQPSLACIWSE